LLVINEENSPLYTVIFSLIVFSQNEQLAQNYFDKGDFEKAKISYEELLKSQIGNSNYFQKLIDCYQQLQQFDVAEKRFNPDILFLNKLVF